LADGAHHYASRTVPIAIKPQLQFRTAGAKRVLLTENTKNRSIGRPALFVKSNSNSARSRSPEVQ
jgi:hypothetical protein